jgi:hypothetical protein
MFIASYFLLPTNDNSQSFLIVGRKVTTGSKQEYGAGNGDG